MLSPNRSTHGKRKRRLPNVESLEARRVLDSTVVFNEIMYHPADTSTQGEFVELHNQHAVDLDVSGWRLDGGIQFGFPAGTIVPGGGYIVVAATPEQITPTADSLIMGPFAGRLANGGEELRLLDRNDRRMDVVDYDDEGSWPTAPDGTGASLAKRLEDTLSDRAANWIGSVHVGGTPGRENFPQNVKPPADNDYTLVEQSDAWRFDASGNDLGGGWTSPSFDDSAWLGDETTGPYYAGDARLDGSTPSQLTGVTATASSHLAGHDPIFAANGAGIVADTHVTQPSSGTMWLSAGTMFVAVPDPQPEITFDLGSAQTVDTMDVWNFNNVDTETCCTNRGVALADIHVAGNDGNFRVLIEDQAFAIAPGTETDFSQTIDLGGVEARYVKFDIDTTDGVANHGDSLDLVGLSEVKFFSQPFAGETEVALGANTHYFRKQFEFDDAPERTRLQMKLLIDDGAIVYLNGDELYRHNLPSGPIDATTNAQTPTANATFVEVDVPVTSLQRGTNVLAVETHQAEAADSDMAFGMQLTAVTSPALPVDLSKPTAMINELPGSTDGGVAFVELTNQSNLPLDVSGMQIRGGEATLAQVAANTILDAGELVSVNLPTAAAAGQLISLVSADGQLVYDAVVQTGQGLGRHTEFDGFLVTSAATPGTTNRFELTTDVVINEIMYNHRPNVEVPDVGPTFTSTPLVALDHVWRLNQAGESLPEDWAMSEHPVGGDWTSGPGLIGVESATLPAPGLQTPLEIGVAAYYFESDFTLTEQQLAEADRFQFRHLIDDGAVFYVNGVEVTRFNMPDGPIDAQTRSASSLQNANLSEPVPLDKTLFQVGKNRISVSVHQRTPTSNDVVFGMQLFSDVETAPGIPGTPYSEVNEEWIELFNRGETAIDLVGWQLDDAVRMTVPTNTVIGAGEYRLAVQDRATFVAKYPELESLVIGEYSGRLNNKNERIRLLDQRGNPVDSVEYFQNGQWPAAADGGGSSLELRDPFADNQHGLAWAASDEARNSEWREYSYQGLARPSTIGVDRQWNEFVLGMLSAGEVLLDDIRVIEDPNGAATDLLQNGSFEADTLGPDASAWRLIGNHRHSEVIVDPHDPTNQVLRFVATSATEHMHNHAETTFANDLRVTDGTEYKITYRAKWISGSNLLHSRLYFNRLAQATPIVQPDKHGTPGVANSRLESNLGPTYDGFIHSPAVPLAAQPVTVTVDAADPDGMQDMTLWYSVEAGAWQSIPMAATPSGEYAGTIPGQETRNIVQFYVEGTDGKGATTTFPRDGRSSRAMYQVEDDRASATGVHNLRLIVRPDDADFMHSSIELMSNDPTGATVIYNESEIFYDANVRLSGSQRARPNQPRLAFSVGFASDQLFRGLHGRITLDRSESTGFGQREHLYHQGATHAGGLPTEYNDLFNIITPQDRHTGTAEVQMSRYSDVFLDEQFENGSDGQLYEYELVYYPTSTVDRDPESRKVPSPDSVDGVAITDLGDGKEDYRWAFLNRNGRDADNYDQLIEFTKIMGLRNEEFESQISDVIDVDQWLRAFAFSTITGHGDNYGADGAQHNLQLFVRPSDQRVLFFPHDLDAFFTVNRALVGNPDLRKLLRVPEWEHMYFGHVHDMIQTTFNAAYMTRWTEHYQTLLPAQRFDRHLSDLVERSEFLIGQVERQADPVDFMAATETPTVTSTTGEVTGTGWVNVREIRLVGSEEPLDVTWTDVTDWTVRVPLAPGENQIVFEAYDFQGQLLGSNAVMITREGFTGDLNQDGAIDNLDIDLVCAAILANDLSVDLNNDGQMTDGDLDVMVRDIVGTTYGDANLDGTFNSNDLVLLFQSGGFEDDVDNNAGWATGDWNCDGEFTSADFVVAFRAGGYVPAARGADRN